MRENALAGRLCLVTGGSRGIGLGIARAFGKAGARVIVSARTADAVRAAEQSLAAEGIHATGLVFDVADADSAAAFVGRLAESHGPVDVLVNNAGATWGAPAEDYPLAGWTKVVNVNLTGTWALTQAVAVNAMLPRQSGSIIMIGSIAGLGGVSPDDVPTIAYNATKAAQINMVRNLAAEWGPRGVRVNALLPGWMPTKMSQRVIDEKGEIIRARIPLRRFGRADEDMAGPALFLASDASAYVTGQALCVDGGLSALVG